MCLGEHEDALGEHSTGSKIKDRLKALIGHLINFAALVRISLGVNWTELEDQIRLLTALAR